MYKGQGRNQRGLLNRAYKAFLVEDPGCNDLSPSRLRLRDYPSLPAQESGEPCGSPCKLVGTVSVARVRPGTSKGITDLLLRRASAG